MKALTIEFKEKPEGLEEMLDKVPALKKIANLAWKWASNLGDISVIMSGDSHSATISSNYNASIIQIRVNNLANRIQEKYPNCEIKSNKDFYTLD